MFVALLAGAAAVAIVIRLRRPAFFPEPHAPATRFRDTRLLVRRLVTAAVTLGVAAALSWALMLIPPVNDAVLGDLPRDLRDFARMCEDGGSDENGESFPRAASYEPKGGSPHSWVAIEDAWPAHSSSGTDTKEPVDLDHEPAADSVQLVLCSKVSGAVPGTEISCSYTNGPLGYGPVTQTVEFSRGSYVVSVFEARTGELVASRTLRGDNTVECAQFVAEERAEPRYTTPPWDAYAGLINGLSAPPSGT
ncbi:hypothetical protein ACGH7X_00750 [Streptomyces sp. BBFR51]|uniref:hypothetical protein n=1 Tax=Streptomyces sp. BBFR51 TaxID=3372856 RepID=UPI0037DD3EF6